MGVYIPNISKPKSCKECSFKTCFIRVNIKSYTCLINGGECEKTDCPLIEIDLEKDIPTIWYNRQTRRYEPKGTKQEVYERLYKLKNGERRNE